MENGREIITGEEREERRERMLLRRIANLQSKVRDFEEFKSSFSIEPEEISGLVDKIERQEKETTKQRNDLIQYFGLFVAIFTAISIDIQLLKFAQNVWQIAGLMFIVNTAPLFFFFFIRWIYKDEFKWGDFGRFIAFFVVIFGVGTLLLWLGNDWKPETVIERTESQKTESINTTESMKETEDIQKNMETTIKEMLIEKTDTPDF